MSKDRSPTYLNPYAYKKDFLQNINISFIVAIKLVLMVLKKLQSSMPNSNIKKKA